MNCFVDFGAGKHRVAKVTVIKSNKAKCQQTISGKLRIYFCVLDNFEFSNL